MVDKITTTIQQKEEALCSIGNLVVSKVLHIVHNVLIYQPELPEKMQ